MYQWPLLPSWGSCNGVWQPVSRSGTCRIEIRARMGAKLGFYGHWTTTILVAVKISIKP